MGTASRRGRPNERLRYQRHLRGWTLREVADKLYDLCASEGEQESGMSADTVGRWELGVSKPSLFYQQKLCALFGQSAAELGLIEPLSPPEERLPGVASRGQPVAAVPLPSSSQPIDLLAEVSGLAPEELSGAWLEAGATHLSALLAAGWSPEEVLTSLYRLCSREFRLCRTCHDANFYNLARLRSSVAFQCQREDTFQRRSVPISTVR